MNSMKIYFSIIASTIYLLANNTIVACSSCNVRFSYTQKQLDAYFGTTLLLAICPVAFTGLLVYAVYKSSKAQKEN